MTQLTEPVFELGVEAQGTRKCSVDDRFHIGAEVLLAPVEDGTQQIPLTTEPSEPDSKRDDALKEIRVRVGTLLKTETVSLLLGAGASVDWWGSAHRLRSASRRTATC